MRLNYIDVI